MEAEYRREKFATDPDDPIASWVRFLQTTQGSVELSFRTDSFHSEACTQTVGAFQLVDFASSDAVDYRRTDRNVRVDGDGSYRLMIPLEGSFRLEQSGSRELFRPGMLGFVHWSRPLNMAHDDRIRALIMTVPEGSIDSAGAEHAPLALAQERPLVRLLEESVRMLADLEGWTAADFSVAFTNALDLLDGALSTDPRI